MTEEIEGYTSPVIQRDGDKFQLNISVLGFEEDEHWCAMALEMSLCGYGNTYGAAVKDLKAAMTEQINFTLKHGNLDQLLFPAEDHYFERYAQANSP